MDARTRIVLGHGEPAALDGYAALVAGDDRFALLASAADANRFLTAVALHRPALAAFSAAAWEGGPLGVVARLTTASPETTAVVVGTCATAEETLAVARAGGSVLDSTRPGPKLLDALAKVSEGQTLLESAATARRAGSPLPHVTDRQVALLSLIASGHQLAEAADTLHIALPTAKKHLYAAKDALRARTVEHAIFIGAQLGLLGPFAETAERLQSLV